MTRRLSSSIVHELRRLCAPPLDVERESEHRGNSTTVDHVARVERAHDPDRAPSNTVSRHATLVRVCVPDVVDGERRNQPVFDMAVPQARLALLARIAWLSSTRRVADLPDWLVVPLLVRVATVQLALDLHMTERLLSQRLGIAPSTMRRWFAKETDVLPSRFQQWMRAHAVVRRLVANGETSAQVAEALGFAHVESLRRLLRNLTRMDTAMLRTSEGARVFERQMRCELLGEQIRA